LKCLKYFKSNYPRSLLLDYPINKSKAISPVQDKRTDLKVYPYGANFFAKKYRGDEDQNRPDLSNHGKLMADTGRITLDFGYGLL